MMETLLAFKQRSSQILQHFQTKRDGLLRTSYILHNEHLTLQFSLTMVNLYRWSTLDSFKKSYNKNPIIP